MFNLDNISNDKIHAAELLIEMIEKDITESTLVDKMSWRVIKHMCVPKEEDNLTE